MNIKVGLFIVLLLTGVTTFAQDTLHYTIQKTEAIFLENNLPLLAEKLQISQSEAKILQAKAWPNPNFELGEVQLYNTPNTDASPPLFGNFWRNRTFSAQLEQLVYTARKRKKNISLEVHNKALAESTFTDMLQSLKADFRQTAAELIYLQQVQGDQLYQFSVVEKLVKAQQAQLKEGNISQSELFRIKALQVSLQSDINSIHEEISGKQETLKNLMGIDAQQYLVLAATTTDLKEHTLSELLTLAAQHNTGILISQQEKQVSEAALVVEKANRVPDVTFNLSYDRNGNNQLNFLGAGIAMDLPVFNRNKGNIKAAQLEVQKSELLQQYKVTTVNNAVVKAYTDMHKAIELYEGIDRDYLDKLDGMMAGISRNFISRNISMLEFLDFFESFRESKAKYYEAARNISLKKESLNYLTGTEL